MTEEKTEPPQPEEKTEPAIDEAAHAKRLSEINEATMKLDNANAEFKANQEVLKAQEHLKKIGGKADAGQPAKKETPQQYAERVMRGEL